ncbi:uncharacterized protein NPIL_297851 [Nephila pilipes]|uniref:LolA-like domain-containing protein n=1 Tax=Nephila pilipes TaxID=299642 RepID=A0A8X6P7A4_NEPPI|nr:uncharacterized protein NPIL_297851 [Nephila pilipes]
MAAVWWSALLLALSVQIARTEYDPDVCTLYKDSYGLIPPPLPRNFELKGDKADYLKKTAYYLEMHFDFSNSRAKYMYLLNGIERHLLFDYDARQVVEYDIFHPGRNIKDDPLSHECTATDLDDSEYKYMFGFLDEYTNWPKMYDQYQVMRFGGQYSYAFNGTYRMEERGLLVDKFAGCVYEQDVMSTVAVNYSFTNSAVFTAGGTSVEDVLGVGDGMLSVPTRMEFFGTELDPMSQQRMTLNMSENTFWFKGEPEFAVDTFRIPPYMYCENFRGRKDMAEFPAAFSTRVQKTKIQRDTLGKLATSEVTSFEQIYYYKDKNLARRDHTPDPDYDTDIYSKFLNYDPVRSIYDFNTGVMYITNVATGVCYYRSIIPGDYFDASKQHMYIKMADPNEVFRMEHDEMECKGSDFVRDIECDVWAGKYFDELYNATYIKETYVSTLRQVSQADMRTLLIFTLVGKPRLRTQTPVGQPGASLDDAFKKLQNFIDRNQFAIRFVAPQTTESITIKALRGSLYIRKADGDLEAPTADVSPTSPMHGADNGNASDGDDEEKKGMSPGSLALLALAMLFIGVGIGIAVMYLYLTKMSEKKLEDRITLTPQVSLSTDVESAPVL